MSGYIILMLLFIVGTILLAHHMGKDVGREQEFVRQKKGQSYCPECKMLAQPASIYTQPEGSRK